MFKLNIEKKCLDRVLSGEQKEVYQLDIPVNEEALTNVWGKDQSAWKNPQRVTLTESEEEGARFAIAVCTLAKGEGWPEWGAEKGVIYFILKIQRLEASCEVVAEEEKVADPIAEDKVEEVPVAEKDAEKPCEECKVEEVPEVVAEPVAEPVVEEEVKAEEPVKAEPEKTEEVKAEEKAEEKTEVKEEVKAAEKESK